LGVKNKKQITQKIFSTYSTITIGSATCRHSGE